MGGWGRLGGGATELQVGGVGRVLSHGAWARCSFGWCAALFTGGRGGEGGTEVHNTHT